jgi:heme O synthase-like polyprenyltransferase
MAVALVQFGMQNWIYVAVAALLAIPLAWMALRSREATFDIEPVSRQWLEEQKRTRGEA